MPRLLARKYNQKINVRNYYNAMYAGDFLDFHNTNHYAAKGSFVIWYQHSYAEKKKQPILDHDNMETKAMTDMVSRIIGQDDSAFDCSTFVSSIQGDEDCTIIRVIPKEQFASCLNLYF